MATKSSQKFIARNRAPRVQIEYDDETKGGQQALEFDGENFDKRLAAMKPRVTFTVPNKLTGEGSLPVDITFESMDDFSPAAIAKKIEPLRQLLEARTQLASLVARMDGKADAEQLVSDAIKDPELLAKLVAAGKPDSSGG